MSKPKIIKAIDDLDYQGFYNKSTYLGDIRTDSTCLDSVLENGIYTFTGGLDEPTDTSHVGDYKWSLLVKSNQDSTSSIQIAERISGLNTNRKLPYYRYYSSGTWTEFKQELQYLKVRSAGASYYIEIDGGNISFSTPDGGGLYFLDEGSPGSPVLAFYGNLSDELVRLTRIADPENDYDAANKKYADSKLSKSGDTMTGDLVLNADPTTDMQAATKKYVDDKVKDAVPAFSNGPIVIESSMTFVPSDYGISIGDKIQVICVGGGGGGGNAMTESNMTTTIRKNGDSAGLPARVGYGDYGCGGHGGNYYYNRTTYSNGGGGGSGYLSKLEVTVDSNSIPVTVGAGGGAAANGGSTSFGSYLTAEGGNKGGDGVYNFDSDKRYDGSGGSGGHSGSSSASSSVGGAGGAGWTIKSYIETDSSGSLSKGSGVVMIWY